MYFDSSRKTILLDSDPRKNIIQIDSADWQLLSLDLPCGNSRSSNAFIFQAYPLEDESQRSVIKICRYHNEGSNSRCRRRVARFEREITALQMILGSGSHTIAVDIFANGRLEVKSTAAPHAKLSFRYYVMEKADQDLVGYIESTPIGEQQRLHLCSSLLQSLKNLHSLGIYHRDIKPSNILLFGTQWKLADLGLASFRNEDVEIDLPDEKIGPIGWLSPEAVNKACANRNHPAFSADVNITDASDVFQLGKLFWYIMYGSVPTGQMDVNDCGMPELFNNIISPMLQYSKARRAVIGNIETALHPILQAYGI